MAPLMGEVPRLLAIMGSGETSPTMSSVHTDLLGRMGPPAVLLDTPFGFQENADELVTKAVAYFRRSVGSDIGIASLRRMASATPLEVETCLARIAEAHYIFAGPGSPSYALRQWLGSPIVAALREKLRTGGCLVFASAAAVGVGQVALPVYEIYKVGEDPHWLEGLDLLVETGLRAAVIPHFDNAEGGTHDTRYCYMGLRRIGLLEEQLPEGVDILGVDEHTVAVFDLDAAMVRVQGRGALTLRRRGMERRFEAGETLPVEVLTAGPAASPAVRGPAGSRPAEHRPVSPFAEIAGDLLGRAHAALEGSDPEGMAVAMLDLEDQLNDWAEDSPATDERDRARAGLRQLVVRLGELAREGAIDPRERARPFVEPILELRRRARRERRFDEADRLRELLAAAGVEVRDTPGGSEWSLAGAGAPGPRAAAVDAEVEDGTGR